VPALRVIEEDLPHCPRGDRVECLAVAGTGVLEEAGDDVLT
jgi:hypothetical protein